MNSRLRPLNTKIFLIFAVLFESFCFSQNDSVYYYFEQTTPVEALLKKLESTKNPIDKDYYKLIYFSKLRNKDSMFQYMELLGRNKKKLSKVQSVRLEYFSGYFYKISDNDSLYFSFNLKAYNNALAIQDSSTVLRSLSALGQCYDYKSEYSYNLEYLNLLESKAQAYHDNYFKIIHRYLLGNYYLFREKNFDAIKHYKELLDYKFTKKDSIYLLYAYNNLGVLYQENLKKHDSAIYFYEKKLDLLNKNNQYKTNIDYFITNLNLANSFESKKDFEKAEHYYKIADSIPINQNVIQNKYLIKENLSKLFAETNNYKGAYLNLKESNKYLDSLKREDQRTAVAKIKEQYDNEKLRADNLESESERKQNQNLFFVALAFILFGGITAFLIQKNTRKKQKLAEQGKALETQKLVTVLKEQELMSIDAMIAGQEKERQRIANDLHDDLGGLMANVKLHFNVLKDKQTPELFDKTTNLLEEAYQKIRSIAHTKNSGVIAKQGLLKAVQNMADNISDSNKMVVDVIDHGLENRLENSLELTIFRIIQELIANVIKHAEATEATIHLTNHEDSLNIMVEDNGKGFNPSQITTKNKGMGISSIDKRVEHLNGNMTIESEINKGTTIIIDIPI